MIKFFNGLEHGYNILVWHIGHDVMNRIKDKPTTNSKYLKVMLHMILHLLRGRLVQYTFGIASATPESNIAAEFLFQTPGFYINCINLDRIQNFEAGVNQFRNQFINTTTAVQHCMHGRIVFHICLLYTSPSPRD